LKKLWVAIVLCLLSVVILTSPAFAAAQSSPLTSKIGAAGGGFVIFSTPAGEVSAGMTLSLMGVMPNKSYDLYIHLYVPGGEYYFNEVQDGDSNWHIFPVGTITTNKAGNGTFHLNVRLPSDQKSPDPFNVVAEVVFSGSTPFDPDSFAPAPENLQYSSEQVPMTFIIK
jgi:hypothetical protein